MKKRKRKPLSKRYQTALRRYKIVQNLTEDNIGQLPEKNAENLNKHLEQASRPQAKDSQATNNSIRIFYQSMVAFIKRTL